MADPILSSTLSYAEVLAIYQDYSDYDLEASASRAKIFIKAARMLLSYALRRSGQSSRAEEIEVEPEILEREKNKAVCWLASYNALNTLPRQVVPDPDWREE